MKTILALSAAGVALFAAASVANAQDCINGYRWIKDSIPVVCDGGPVLPEASAVPTDPLLLQEERLPVVGAVPAGPLPEEPLFTGSIGPSDQPPTSEVGAVSAGRLPEEPLYTGSINSIEPSDQPPTSEPGSFAASQAECQPGQFWMREAGDAGEYSIPMAC